MEPSTAAQPTLDSTASPAAKLFVRELADGARVESAFVVRDVARRTKKNGDAFLKLQLGDVTGAVEAVVWDGVDAAAEAAAPGSVVLASGTFSVDPRYGACVTIRSLRPALEGEYDPSDLHDGPSSAYGQMVADLRELVGTVQDPHLRGLLERLLSDSSPVWERWKDAPAAKHYHQAYRHGLLEHCLTVARAVSAISATFAGVDRDIAITGALLHDIGKLDAYACDGHSIELTDAGRLHGEIALGYYRIRRAIENIEGFPVELAGAIGHIILSHHGALGPGSPVLPCTPEATLVHMIDNLGGRLGSFDRLERGLPPGRRWSGFDRAIGTGAFFADRPSASARAAELGELEDPPAREAA